MIERLSNLPDNILGVRASGHVTAADYESVLIPAIEAELKRHGTIRMLYQIGPDYSGFSAGAMWDDAKIGVRHLKAYERVAVVTDVEWIANAVNFFRFAMHGGIRVFPNAQYDDALAWLKT